MSTDRIPPESSHSNGRSLFGLSWQAVGCLILLSCILCSGVVGLTGLIAVRQGFFDDQSLVDLPTSLPTARPALIPVEPEPTKAIVVSPTQSPLATDAQITREAGGLDASPLLLKVPDEIVQTPIDEIAESTLHALMTTEFPPRDYFESAGRLGNLDLGNRTFSSDALRLGATRSFFSDEGRVDAELMAITENTYFWADTGLRFTPLEMARIAEQFDVEMYDAIVELFGQEWRPGIDNDPRFHVLHLERFANDRELGFFDSGDEYPLSISSVSNEMEIVYLNMDSLDLGSDLYFGTLAHEVQHMILWHQDPNETVWMSEALAQLTELYLGFDTVDSAIDYLAAPGTQLNEWEYEDQDSILAHYGAGYLLAVYLWEQLGPGAIKTLARSPADGLAALSHLLVENQSERTLNSFFADWAVANYLDGESEESRFSYANLELGRPSHAIEMKEPPFETTVKINQFGVDYALLDLSGELTISFAGNTTYDLMGQIPSGQLAWFSPGLDEMDATLTADFDLTNVNTATLSFSCWYDLQADLDFAYISISTDGGVTWRLLTPEHASAGEFGPGITGRSRAEFGHVDGWVQEEISLNRYVGQQVTIRFELLTDAAIPSIGFGIDNISIAEIGYSDSVEAGSDRWRANGFVQSGPRLPQLWEVVLIQLGETPKVTALDLNPANQGRWRVDLGNEGGVLVIAPVTTFANKPATYWLSMEK